MSIDVTESQRDEHRRHMYVFFVVDVVVYHDDDDDYHDDDDDDYDHRYDRDAESNYHDYDNIYIIDKNECEIDHRRPTVHRSLMCNFLS